MAKPKFTDLDKYPNGYTPANKSDIRKTFERIKKQQQQIRQEQKDKVKTINWRTA
jgi:ABC-type Zn uptake system ZnuABC Zn-binding protein ZnuA